MIRMLARLFLLRFLPARLVPILTAYEIYRLVRRRRAAPGPPARTVGPAVSPTDAPIDPQVAQGGRARVGR
jgi:hypothetical protein